MKEMMKGGQAGSAASGRAERLRHHIGILADRLPDMISNVIAAYQHLAAREMADDVKSVAAHQAALCAILAHLEALLDLVRWLDKPGTAASSQNDEHLLEHLYNEAAAAVALLAEQQDD